MSYTYIAGCQRGTPTPRTTRSRAPTRAGSSSYDAAVAHAGGRARLGLAEAGEPVVCRAHGVVAADGLPADGLRAARAVAVGVVAEARAEARGLEAGDATHYNANGDMTSDGLRSYSYDAEGRLSAVTTGATDASPTTRYAHNALGQRVFKTEPLYPPAEGDESDPGFFQTLLNFFAKLWGPTTTDAERLGFAFVYDEDGTLIAESGTGGASSTGSTQYIHLPTASGPMPIAAIINGTKYAVHSDHLNTPRRMTNESGQAVWQWSYSAFGDEKPTVAKYRFANLDVNPNPGTTSIAEVTNNLRYPGQYADKESGLHYNYFRSYDSRTGRYSQPDPIGLDGGWNRFGYVDADPLSFTDPEGLRSRPAERAPGDCRRKRLQPSSMATSWTEAI